MLNDQIYVNATAQWLVIMLILILEYRIKLVTRVLVNFQHNYFLISTIGLTLKSFSCSVLASSIPNGAYSLLFLIFCAGNIFNHGNLIVSHKYNIIDMNQIIIVIIKIYSTYLLKWWGKIPTITQCCYKRSISNKTTRWKKLVRFDILCLILWMEIGIKHDIRNW